MPRERAASICPRGTASMPARIVSAIYAAATSASGAAPWMYMFGQVHPVAIGTPKPRINSVTSSGMPRSTSMYVAANHLYGRTLDNLIKARIKPRPRPPMNPKNVKISVLRAALVRMSGNCSLMICHLNMAFESFDQSTMRISNASAINVAAYTK